MNKHFTAVLSEMNGWTVRCEYINEGRSVLVCICNGMYASLWAKQIAEAMDKAEIAAPLNTVS